VRCENEAEIYRSKKHIAKVKEKLHSHSRWRVQLTFAFSGQNARAEAPAAKRIKTHLKDIYQNIPTLCIKQKK